MIWNRYVLLAYLQWFCRRWFTMIPLSWLMRILHKHMYCSDSSDDDLQWYSMIYSDSTIDEKQWFSRRWFTVIIHDLQLFYYRWETVILSTMIYSSSPDDDLYTVIFLRMIYSDSCDKLWHWEIQHPAWSKDDGTVLWQNISQGKDLVLSPSYIS